MSLLAAPLSFRPNYSRPQAPVPAPAPAPVPVPAPVPAPAPAPVPAPVPAPAPAPVRAYQLLTMQLIEKRLTVFLAKPQMIRDVDPDHLRTLLLPDFGQQVDVTRGNDPSHGGTCMKVKVSQLTSNWHITTYHHGDIHVTDEGHSCYKLGTVLHPNETTSVFVNTHHPRRGHTIPDHIIPHLQEHARILMSAYLHAMDSQA